jgi:hypothetical protein
MAAPSNESIACRSTSGPRFHGSSAVWTMLSHVSAAAT